MREAIVTGVVSGVVTGIILAIIFWAWRCLIRWLTSEVFKVKIKKPPPEMLTNKFKFGVLYVQDEDETIRNTTHWFKKKRTGKLYVNIRHPRNLGFQYKCFVDNHSKCNFSQISTYLAGAGYTDISLGVGKPDRVWFIIPGNPTATDSRGNLNNYYYPV